MRSKYLEVTSVALLLTLMLITGTTHWVQAAEQEFDDDGIVEDDDVSETNGADDSAEEIKYESPQFDPKQFYFVDHFDDIAESSKRWIKSEAKKDDIAEEIAKYDGIWSWEAPQRIVWGNDIGLVLKSNAKHAAISSPLDKIFSFNDEKPLVVQYEVTMQDGQECGGSYIKLLSEGKATEDLTKFNDKTPYTIMFGPDKCGNDHKMHFIFRHVNPLNGSISEKHCRKPKQRLEEPFKDKLPHLYTLIVKPDNSYEIRVDHKIINEGSLLTEFTPPVNPPREIDDPKDIKPEDWDEREKIPDPTAVKPDDWDDDAPPQIPDMTAVKPDDWLEEEPEMIPDPTAVKPEDWDAEIDGEWEAPMVDNPVCEKVAGCGPWKAPLVPNKEYKGKWRAPLIENPNYQGKWSARKIPNPDFFEDLAPFKMTPISAIGIELWSMSRDILFDNLIVTDELAVALDFASKTFDLKRKHIDKESKTFFHRLMKRMNYKPGWWALYFLYLLIPASCYVAYLYMRAKEETFMNMVMSYFTENPWAWRIAIVLIGTPLAFSVYRLFSKNSSSKESSTTDPKKTDAVQEDDDVDASSGDAKNNTDNNSSPKKKKSDLDIKEDDAGETNVETVEDVVDEASDEKESDEAVEENDSVVEEEKPQETEATVTKSGTRKRRVRKDQS